MASISSALFYTQRFTMSASLKLMGALGVVCCQNESVKMSLMTKASYRKYLLLTSIELFFFRTVSLNNFMGLLASLDTTLGSRKFG